jgi:hypothetical protein
MEAIPAATRVIPIDRRAPDVWFAQMIRAARTFLAAVLILATAAATASEDEGTAAGRIRESFADYRAAILADAGTAAAEMVSSASIEYFASMRQLALYASSKEVRSQSLVDQMQILTFRHRIDAERLRAMSSKQLFAYTVDRGWTGKAGVLELELGSIRVVGDVAFVNVLKDGKPTRLEYQYVREQNTWLWDMEPALHSTNKGLKMLAAQRELSNEELVLALVEATYGGPVQPTIWNPLFGAPQK